MDATNPTLLAPANNAAIAAELEVKRPTNLLQTKHWLRSLPPLQLLPASQKLADEIAVLNGLGQTPANGCFHAWCRLGDAAVLVEFQHEPSEGDGYHEPRYEESIAPVSAWINGEWVDANPDNFGVSSLERWHLSGVKHLEKLRAQDEEDRAAAQYADRMERCG